MDALSYWDVKNSTRGQNVVVFSVIVSLLKDGLTFSNSGRFQMKTLTFLSYINILSYIVVYTILVTDIASLFKLLKNLTTRL